MTQDTRDAKDEFMPPLLRLQRLLGVSKDKEVAEALGLSVTALSERKRRGSFPIERLHDLARRRPDLAIDAHYVLTGHPTPAPASLPLPQGEPMSHRVPRECTYSYARNLRLRYTAPRYLLLSVPVSLCGDDRIDVVGDPDNAAYEWVIVRGGDRRGVFEHSDSGYGSTEVALRDGLIAYLGPPDSLKPVKPAGAPPPAEAIPGLGVTEIFGEGAP